MAEVMKLANTKQSFELLARIEKYIAYRRENPDGLAYVVSGLKQLIQEAKRFNSDIEQKSPQLQIDVSKFEEELPQLEKEEIQARLEKFITYRRENPDGLAYVVSGLKQLIQEAKRFNSDIEQKSPQLQIDVSKFEEELPQLEKEEIK